MKWSCERDAIQDKETEIRSQSPYYTIRFFNWIFAPLSLNLLSNLNGIVLKFTMFYIEEYSKNSKNWEKINNFPSKARIHNVHRTTIMYNHFGITFFKLYHIFWSMLSKKRFTITVMKIEILNYFFVMKQTLQQGNRTKTKNHIRRVLATVLWKKSMYLF